MTDEDLDRLEALARAAMPGPWRPGNPPNEEDRDYIAGANPAVVLVLLAEVRAARKGNPA